MSSKSIDVTVACLWFLLISLKIVAVNQNMWWTIRKRIPIFIMISQSINVMICLYLNWTIIYVSLKETVLENHILPKQPKFHSTKMLFSYLSLPLTKLSFAQCFAKICFHTIYSSLRPSKIIPVLNGNLKQNLWSPPSSWNLVDSISLEIECIFVMYMIVENKSYTTYY